jgi:RNA polymerase sigma-54 factor
MELNVVQGMVQQQKLVLTPEMQQSLKILQMPLYELQDDIMRELAENPVLEVAASEDGRFDDLYPAGENITDEKRAAVDDADIDGYRLLQDEVKAPDERVCSGIDYTGQVDRLNFVVAKKTLKDYLKEQLLDLNESESVIAICNYIIENIDERGYLSCSIDQLAAELKVSVERVAYALDLVREFQPWGVAARDLKECLIIQLRKKQLYDATLGRMVAECLELIAANKIREIARKLELNLGKVQRYCQIIRSLEPKPARGFDTGNPEYYIVPEAYITKNNDELVIVMNEGPLPRLVINQLYKRIIKQPENEASVSYVKDKINRAMFLIKGIEHRKNTIYNILAQIIELQKDYFKLGEQYLLPMTFADIAGRLGIHESTISRAIKEKYICTPFKTVKLKDLFSTGLHLATTEESISVKLIKKEIRKLIDGEDKTQPFSDQDICNLLKKMEIEISRRTVAKYREEMAIGSSVRRRMFGIR